MHPRSFECARCGMAVPAEARRCPSCRARRRIAPVAASTDRFGPAAAEAWAARPPRPPSVAAGPAGDVRATRPVGPGAVAASVGLHVVGATALAVAAVQGARLALAVAGSAGGVLASTQAGDGLADLARVAVALAAGATMLATLLVVGWFAVAGLNVRPLALDPRRWVHGFGRVAGRLGVLVAVGVAWRWAPGRPDRLDRCVELGLGIAAAAALLSASSATRRFVVAVSAAELERAELLVRLERAAADRPRRGHSPA